MFATFVEHMNDVIYLFIFANIILQFTYNLLL